MITEDISKKTDNKIVNLKRDIASLSVVGFGVGILVGLSASPIVGSVIGGILATATTALAILMGMKQQETRTIHMASLAWFTSFLVFGALSGVIVRSNGLLGPGVLFGMNEVDREVAVWVDLKMNKDEVVRAIFAKEYPLSNNVRTLRITDPSLEFQKWASLPISDTVLLDNLMRFTYPLTADANQTDTQTDVVGSDMVASVLWARDIEACNDLFSEFDRYGTVKEALTFSVLSRWRALAVIEDVEALQHIVSEDLCLSSQYQWPWE